MFTHDDRLPDAVRHLLIPATVIEVMRRPTRWWRRDGLSVQSKYLDDAHAIRKTSNLPADVQRRVIPGFCRSAVEAACMDAVRRRRLKAGDTHQAVEDLLADHKTLTNLMALTLLDDGEKGSEVMRTLNRSSGAGRGTCSRW